MLGLASFLVLTSTISAGVLSPVVLFVLAAFGKKSVLIILAVLTTTSIQSTVIITQPSRVISNKFTISYAMFSSGFQSRYVVFSEEGESYLANLPSYPKYLGGETVSLSYQKVKELDLTQQYDFYLKTLGLSGVITPSTVNLVEQPSKGDIFLSQVRSQIEDTVNISLAEPKASLLRGMLLGARAEFPDEFSAQLRRSGTSHIVAVSGYNFSILALSVLFLAGRFPRRMVAILAILLCWGFLFLVGTENIPAFRAALMITVALIAYLTGRPNSIVIALTYAITLIIVINPWVIYNISFLLSVSATFGVIFLTPLWERLLIKLPAYIRSILATTIAATVATSPILYFAFRETSYTGVLANLFILPLVPLMMLFGMLGVMLSGLPFVGQFIMLPANYLLEVAVSLIAIFSPEWALQSDAGLYIVSFGLMVVLTLLGDFLRVCDEED